MKDEVIRVRVGKKLKELIRKKSGGKMSVYLRDLAIRDIEVDLCDDNKTL